MNGLVLAVSDQEILDAKAIVGRAGLGCEPASAASVAGLKRLIERKEIGAAERVVCVITGHQLKAPDVTVAYHSEQGEELAKHLGKYGVAATPFANSPVQTPNDLQEILRVLRRAK
jgi:threonine synthase